MRYPPLFSFPMLLLFSFLISLRGNETWEQGAVLARTSSDALCQESVKVEILY